MKNNEQYDQIEEDLTKKSRKRRPKMIVSGKSVFLLARQSKKQKKK